MLVEDDDGFRSSLASLLTSRFPAILLDEAANKMGISPLEVRTINAVETGYQTKSVISVGHSEYKKCLQSVAERSGFLEKYGKLPFGRGIGMAGGHYSSGGAYLLYRSYRPHSTANIRIDTEAGVYPMVGPGQAYDEMITGDFIPSRAAHKPAGEAEASEMF